MNYKTLTIVALIILLAAGIAAFVIPNYLATESTSDTSETPSNMEKTTEETADMDDTMTSDEPMADTEAETGTRYGDKGGDTVGYTLADVAKHANKESCWTVVNDNVYDLTPFIDEHPGGAANVMRICGIDGTEAFTDQHGGQAEPESTIREFFIGPVI